MRSVLSSASMAARKPAALTTRALRDPHQESSAEHLRMFPGLQLAQIEPPLRLVSRVVSQILGYPDHPVQLLVPSGKAEAHGVSPREEMARKFLADNRRLRRRWSVGLVEIAPGNQPRTQRGEETRPYLVEQRVVIPLVAALISVRLNGVVAVAARIDSNLRKADIRHPRNGRQPVPHSRVERYQAGVFVAAIVRVHVHHQQPFAAHTRIEAPQLSKAEGEQAGGRHQHERKRDLDCHRHPPRQPAPRRRGHAPR